MPLRLNKLIMSVYFYYYPSLLFLHLLSSFSFLLMSVRADKEVAINPVS